MRISDWSSDVCSSDLDNWYGNGQFRVEEFKLPLLNGHLKIVDQGDSGPLVSPSSLDADIQISYVSGGPAGGLPVSVSGVLRDRQVRFADYEDYSLDPPDERGEAASGEGEQTEGDEQQRLFLDTKPMMLDTRGGGLMTKDALPA